MSERMSMQRQSGPPQRAAMSDVQKLRFRSNCQYIDKLLANIEDVLHAPESRSPFPKYRADVNHAQARMIEVYIQRFRRQLLSSLAWQDIVPPEPEIPATRAIDVNLSFIDVTLADMRPSAMRGSGPMSADAAAQLSGIVHELSSLNDSILRYVRLEITRSMQDRIAVLSPDEATAEIAMLESIVSRHGLVEYRPRLDLLLSRAEDRAFEIAVFGRVSSGKSSFLNAVLQASVLPVGVNPVTATPTRIRYGEHTEAKVRFGTSAAVSTTLDEFRNLISEDTNPGNARTVTRAEIKTPCERLKGSVVFVDTPGLGSLARRGTAETMAYLPSCDLALLLIDAGSTVMEEDLATLRTIHEATIPSLVLLSKCDVLDSSSLAAAVHYVQERISEHMRVTVSVHPVSSLASQRKGLDQFFNLHLQPRIQRAEDLKRESDRRKLLHLRQDIATSLKIRLERHDRPQQAWVVPASEMEAEMRAIRGMVGALEDDIQKGVDQLRKLPVAVLATIANDMVTKDRSPLSGIEARIDERVSEEVERVILAVQTTAGDAIARTAAVGERLERADLPPGDELDAFFRNVPRFTSNARAAKPPSAVWRFFGSEVARSRYMATLCSEYETDLREQLETYVRALQEWAKEFSRALQRSVNGYLDAYRGVMTTAAAEEIDVASIQEDLQRLSVPSGPGMSLS